MAQQNAINHHRSSFSGLSHSAYKDLHLTRKNSDSTYSVSPEHWQKAVSAIERSFESNFWYFAKRITSHVNGNWQFCLKALEKRQFKSLVKNRTRKRGKEIPDSSVLDQVGRRTLLDSSFLKVVFALSVIEIRDGKEKASAWKKVKELYKIAGDQKFIRSEDKYVEIQSTLRKIHEDLRSELYGELGNHKKQNLGRQQSRLLSRLGEELHSIDNALGTSLSLCYETLKLVLWDDKINEEDLFEKTNSIGRCVQEISCSMEKERLKDFILAAEITKAAHGPSDAFNFQTSSLLGIFNRCKRIAAVRERNFILRQSLAIDVGPAIDSLDMLKRADIGLVFSSLLLNGVQALSKQHGKGVVEIRGHVERKGGKKKGISLQVITRNADITEEQLSNARAVIENPEKAKLRSRLNQGGNGLANVSIYLTDKHQLDGRKPTIEKTAEGVICSFTVKLPR